jgi:two-component system sensor histidine kinase RegB
MSKTGAPNRSPSPTGNAMWLTRLRWAAIGGQTITILVAHRIAGPEIRLRPLLGIIAFETAFNLIVLLVQRRGWTFGRTALVSHLTIDLLALTALLHFSGGPSNPFNFLYLVQIVLAAVVLGTGPAYFLAAVSAVLFAALFVPGLRGGDLHSHMMMQWHLQGMWIAFVIAAFLIIQFLGQILSALARHSAELERERERASRHEKVSSLVTLAAGAAHELATPLSTIAVIAGELSHRFQAGPSVPADVSADTTLLRQEVRRCQEILEKMSVAAGQSPGDTSQRVRVSEVVDSVVAPIEGDRIEVRASPEAMATEIVTPAGGLRRSLRAVVDNAIDASPIDGRVLLEIEVAEDDVEFRVIDRGRGIPKELRARVLDPFFTTKPPGRGMGLGLFLADNAMRQMGGSMAIDSGPGARGTCVRLRIPRADYTAVGQEPAQ